jgi:hypothetical protein
MVVNVPYLCLSSAQFSYSANLSELAVGYVVRAKAAIAVDPTCFNAYNHLGLGYMNGCRYEKAVQATEKSNMLLMTL